jgi:hypothetical protein
MTEGNDVRPKVLVAVFLAVTGCVGESPSPQTSEQGPTPAAGPVRNFDDRIYERNVVFMTMGADSAIIVPWLLRSAGSAQGVERTAEAWLARAGLWEPFFTDRWESPATRSPFRIHPHGPMDLVVGPDGALEEILYEEGPRQLEVIIDEGMSDWSGNLGETFRVHQGAAHFGDQWIEGLILDMSRIHRREGPAPGEWMFLTGAGRLALVIVEAGESSTYTAWGRWGEEEYRWPEMEVEWSTVRSFEEARRDVPVGWELNTPDRTLALSLVSAGMELRTGAGEGPLLPVEGLYQVSGSLVLAGDSIEVRGLVRHLQR